MEEIKKILYEGTIAQRRYLFSIDEYTSPDTMVKKFNIFARFFYPKFFKSADAPFHKEMLLNLAKLYTGDIDEFLNIGFRGCSKSTYTKLFMVFVIACDKTHRRRYLKILSEDIKNSKQTVTDMYNLLITPRLIDHYPELWAKTVSKREETMERFTTSTGIKVISGSVGQEQRGQIQEESRPDFIHFDDIESRNTLRSAVTTQKIWDNMQEAINGLAKGGIASYACNYISERGNVHRLVERVKHKMIIPIEDENGEPTWPARYTRAEIALQRTKADDYEGEYLCVKPDTLILTRDGYKQIKDITAGESVITHTGGSHKVLQVFTSEADELLDVTIDGEILTITENHPVMCLRDNKEMWVPAGSLSEGDLVIRTHHGKL